MNIRFSHHAVRVRVTAEELAQLTRERSLREELFVLGGQAQILTLVVGDGVRLENLRGWMLQVPAAALDVLQTGLTEQVSKKDLAFEALVDDITVALEVDVFSLRKKSKL